MAEKEYIEREALSQAILDLPPKMDEQGYGWLGRRGVWQMVNDFPAADVRPVVRGKWSVQEIYKHEMSYGTTAYEPVYKCSACGNLMESYLRYDEPIMPEDADFPRFCPNCGARMEENNERN